MSKMKWLLTAVVTGIIAIQFIPVDRTNPPSTPSESFLAQRSVSPDVQQDLRRACFDCHSNETRWPWYSRVAPVSWLVADDVKRGRREINFSEWTRYSPAKQESRLEDAEKMIKQGEMPLSEYVFLHRAARLSQADVERLTQAFREQRAMLAQPSR